MVINLGGGQSSLAWKFLHRRAHCTFQMPFRNSFVKRLTHATRGAVITCGEDAKIKHSFQELTVPSFCLHYSIVSVGYLRWYFNSLLCFIDIAMDYWKSRTRCSALHCLSGYAQNKRCRASEPHQETHVNCKIDANSDCSNALAVVPFDKGVLVYPFNEISRRDFVQIDLAIIFHCTNVNFLPNTETQLIIKQYLSYTLSTEISYQNHNQRCYKLQCQDTST